MSLLTAIYDSNAQVWGLFTYFSNLIKDIFEYPVGTGGWRMCHFKYCCEAKKQICVQDCCTVIENKRNGGAEFTLIAGECRAAENDTEQRQRLPNGYRRKGNSHGRFMHTEQESREVVDAVVWWVKDADSMHEHLQKVKRLQWVARKPRNASTVGHLRDTGVMIISLFNYLKGWLSLEPDLCNYYGTQCKEKQ